MLFYPSKVGNGRRGVLFVPEKITGRAMLNPVYNKLKHLFLPADLLLDSGAFQDIHLLQRLTPEQALQRQLNFKTYLDALLGYTDWNFEAVATYDQMAGIDEAIVNGRKVKVRGNEESALRAIEETLYSAQYYYSQKELIGTKIIYVAQGINAKQYAEKCVAELLPLMRPTDYFGFGGFCIIGRQRRQLLPVFYETVDRVMPMLRRHNITRAHIFGVCLPEAVTYLAESGRKHGIVTSTDSSAPEFAAIFAGATFENGRQKTPRLRNNPDWRPYTHYHPVELAHENIRRYNEWISPL